MIAITTKSSTSVNALRWFKLGIKTSPFFLIFRILITLKLFIPQVKTYIAPFFLFTLNLPDAMLFEWLIIAALRIIFLSRFKVLGFILASLHAVSFCIFSDSYDYSFRRAIFAFICDKARFGVFSRACIYIAVNLKNCF